MKNHFINGNDIVSLFEKYYERTCILTAIETLCSVNCTQLGLLWSRVAIEKKVKISIKELSEILLNADQIITLTVRSLDKDEYEILVDDGELILNTFPN
jgi:hypothetical protein